ncbi:glycosyltransferase family 2 protein [Rhodopila sp.]|uniref:glycosyltransferase family 2 protein n=1 Tax=Rhodopila sp. TaxID=2480087 RepID=UPI003D0ABE11
MAQTLVIIILHYRGLDDTLECLASLERQLHSDVRIVVVDNGSDDRLTDRFAIDFPWVEVIELESNLGWSGGNNAGIKLAIAGAQDLVCLLNNDTVLPEGAIKRLMETASFFYPCLLHPAIDSYGAVGEAQLDPTIPRPPDLSAISTPGPAGVFQIDRVDGACVLAHVSIFKDIGLIDDRFFLLYEDADLGRRAAKAGYKIFCDSTVRIQHKESKSFGGRRRPIKTYYGLRNTLLYTELHHQFDRGFIRIGRTFGWTVWHTAEAAGAKPRSWWSLLLWTFSGDIFARAVRMAIRDYLLRRFGRLKKSDEAILDARIEPLLPDSPRCPVM